MESPSRRGFTGRGGRAPSPQPRIVVDVTNLDLEALADQGSVIRPWIGVVFNRQTRMILLSAIGETRRSVIRSLRSGSGRA